MRPIGVVSVSVMYVADAAYATGEMGAERGETCAAGETCAEMGVEMGAYVENANAKG